MDENQLLLPSNLRLRRACSLRKNMACINILTVLTGSILLFAPMRVSAGPAAELPLEPAFELAANARSEPVPLRWAGGWVLAKVAINGVDAGWFKIATGWAKSSIDPQVAARLKLTMVSECGLMDGFIQDSGSQIKSYRVDALRCGGAGVRDVRLSPFSLAEMSRESFKMYGEGISGVLGWDLLQTLPFVLNEPGLCLEWRREARPDEGATRVPVIEQYGCPYIGITAGNGCAILAMLNTAATQISIQMPFLRTHAAQLWNGPSRTGGAIFFGANVDDDGLPVTKVLGSMPAARWLDIECGGLKQMMPATINPHDEPSFGEVQIGTGLLRRAQILVNGPGKELWVTPVKSAPEAELVNKDRPKPSPYLLSSALRSAIDFNDPAAVRALVAAGADVTGTPDQLPLATACGYGAREAALALLAAGAHVDPGTGRQIVNTPLVNACGSGDPALIKTLLEKGADPNRANLAGVTPLKIAARGGTAAAVKALRGKARFPKDPTQALQILGEACMGGNLLLAKEMLVPIPDNLRSQLPWETFLECALLYGHEEMVDWLLKTGGPALAATGADLQPLLAAILPTRPEKSDAIRERLVTKLLAAGADPKAARKGVTPLLLAARHGNGIIVKALLAAGAKVTDKDYKLRDPLMRAAAANQPLEVIAPLLKSGLDPNAVDPLTELTILGTYASHGNLEACAALLSAGADPNAAAAFGSPPLLLATNSTRAADEDVVALVKLLLKNGGKPEFAAGTGAKPGLLFGAIVSFRSTLIKPLVDAGASVNTEMFSKVTPLALAAAVSTTAIVQELLDLGADPERLDVMGVSPLAHAAAAGKTGSMALLLAKGASPVAIRPEAKPPVWVAASVGQLSAVRVLLAAGADADALNPQTKTTAFDVAKSRGDQQMVKLLEDHPRKK